MTASCVTSDACPDGEGYVKYICRHEPAPAPEQAGLAELDALRTELFDAGLIGQRPDGTGCVPALRKGVRGKRYGHRRGA